MKEGLFAKVLFLCPQEYFLGASYENRKFISKGPSHCVPSSDPNDENLNFFNIKLKFHCKLNFDDLCVAVYLHLCRLQPLYDSFTWPQASISSLR